jgi:hypothetical protein
MGAGIFSVCRSAAKSKIARVSNGVGVGVGRMLLKQLALALALGSIGLFAVVQLSGGENNGQLQLEATIEAQLKALRKHLFTR